MQTHLNSEIYFFRWRNMIILTNQLIQIEPNVLKKEVGRYKGKNFFGWISTSTPIDMKALTKLIRNISIS